MQRLIRAFRRSVRVPAKAALPNLPGALADLGPFRFISTAYGPWYLYSCPSAHFEAVESSTAVCPRLGVRKFSTFSP